MMVIQYGQFMIILRNHLTDIDGGFKRQSVINEKGEGVIFTTDKKEFRHQHNSRQI